MNAWQWRLLAVVLWFVCLLSLIGSGTVNNGLAAIGLLVLAALAVAFGVIAERESEDLDVGRKPTTRDRA